jgi:Ser/Thr protein kinase RdoA (MazF antagonist)
MEDDDERQPPEPAPPRSRGARDAPEASGAAPAAAPFAGLTPDTVLNAIDAAGWRTSGTLLALNSYENRVFQVGIEDAPPVVAKFYRPQRWSDEQIAEEHGFLAELAQHEIPVVPPLALAGTTLHSSGGFRFAVFARRGGRAPELSDPAVRTWLGRFIGRIHAVGASRRYAQRPALDVDSFGVEPSQWLIDHQWLPPELDAVYRGVVAQALDGVRACFGRAGTVRAIRLHGDCHEGNVLWTDAGPHFVDFDDSRSGPALQDLWMLLSGERAEMQHQLTDIVAGYEDFAELDRAELYLLEALRTLRLIHYSAWIARRWDDPAFPAAFPWFETPRYWEQRILELREQIAAMQEAPLVV